MGSTGTTPHDVFRTARRALRRRGALRAAARALAASWLLCACREAPAQQPPPRDSTAAAVPARAPTSLFELIDALLAGPRPLRLEEISLATATRINPDAQQPSPNMTVHHSAPDAGVLVAQTEAWIPNPSTRRTWAGRVILTVRPVPCIRDEQVRARYGDHEMPSIPSPHATSEQPHFASYDRPDQHLAFGLMPTNPAGDPTRQPDAPNTTPRGVALFRVN